MVVGTLLLSISPSYLLLHTTEDLSSLGWMICTHHNKLKHVMRSYSVSMMTSNVVSMLQQGM